MSTGSDIEHFTGIWPLNPGPWLLISDFKLIPDSLDQMIRIQSGDQVTGRVQMFSQIVGIAVTEGHLV